MASAQGFNTIATLHQFFNDVSTKKTGTTGYKYFSCGIYAINFLEAEVSVLCDGNHERINAQ